MVTRLVGIRLLSASSSATGTADWTVVEERPALAAKWDRQKAKLSLDALLELTLRKIELKQLQNSLKVK